MLLHNALLVLDTYPPMQTKNVRQVGPFIDSMHSSFQDGLVLYDGMMLSFEDIFLFQGLTRLIACASSVFNPCSACVSIFPCVRFAVMTLIDKVFATNKDLQVVLVPSLRDANHELVYPQPPFNKKKVSEAFGSPEYAKVSKLSVSTFNERVQHMSFLLLSYLPTSVSI